MPRRRARGRERPETWAPSTASAAHAHAPTPSSPTTGPRPRRPPQARPPPASRPPHRPAASQHHSDFTRASACCVFVCLCTCVYERVRCVSVRVGESPRRGSRGRSVRPAGRPEASGGPRSAGSTAPAAVSAVRSKDRRSGRLAGGRRSSTLRPCGARHNRPKWRRATQRAHGARARTLFPPRSFMSSSGHSRPPITISYSFRGVVVTP